MGFESDSLALILKNSDLLARTENSKSDDESLLDQLEIELDPQQARKEGVLHTGEGVLPGLHLYN